MVSVVFSMRVLSFIFLLLGSASAVYIEICPNANEILPCECEEDDDSGELLVSCSGEDFSFAKLEKALNGLSGKKNVEMELSAIDLGTVPSNFFDGIDIKRLELNQCELDSLSEDGRPALIGLEDSLEELIISYGFSEEKVPAKLQLGHMRKLKDIELSHNVITELGDDWFDKGPPSLEYLTLTNNGINKIGSKAFANLVNLKRLSLVGNRFGPIQSSMLPSPPFGLEILELDNNALTSLPKDIFRAMAGIVGISLKVNGILRLDSETWMPVWQHIRYIAVEENPIECDSHLDWMHISLIVPAIYGKCYSPPEVEGQDIQDFIESRRPSK